MTSWMHSIAALTGAVLLCLSAHVHAGIFHYDDRIDATALCTAFNEPRLTTAVSATTPAAQISLTKSIFADVLPGSDHYNSALSTDSTLRNIYTELSEHYDRSVTEGGYQQFLEATNEISVAKEEACRNASRLTSQSLQVIQEFVNVYKMKDQSSHSIRSVYGKLLCLNSTLNSNSSHASRKRRIPDGGCECPPDGLDSDFGFCQLCAFYACLTDDVIEEIFFKSRFNVDIQCLAFIIDTTSSMVDEIDTAKDVILNFMRSEQDIGDGGGCYMLVEFNDVGPNHQIVPEDSVSDVTFASSGDVLQLSNFYSRVTNIRAGWINGRRSSGGDTPEYALYAMMKALKAREGIYPLLVEGSQMVVLTDAPSKQPELKDNVTDIASGQNVCIHFFINHPDYSLYQDIAESTHGTLIRSFSGWDIANFIANYELNKGCNHLKKRSVSLSCKTVTVSRLAANLRLSINAPTGSRLTITQPNGIVHDLFDNTVLFNQTNPVHGSWKVCSTDGRSIEVTDVITYRIDTTILYWNSNIVPVIPPACTTGRIVVITSEFSSILSASLDFVQARSKTSTITVRVNLTKGCEGALVSDVLTFPNGSYTYRMTGTDIDGVPFNYNSKRIVTFRQLDNGEFSFEPVASLALEMDRDEIVTLDYSFTNRGTYNKTFNFSVNTPEGLATRIDPSSALVTAGATIKLQVLLRVIHSSIKRGTLHTVNVTATISCTGQQIQARARSVFIRELPDYIEDCGDCDGVCLKLTYLGGNFKRCHGSIDNLPRPVCPHGMENVDELKIIYFMEGAHLATFDPLPSCTFGRVGLALSNSTDVKLLSTSIGRSHFHRYDLTMEEFCNGSYLVPAGSMGNFPRGEATYYFEYKYKSNVYNVSKTVEFIKQMSLSDDKPELQSLESDSVEIGTSDNTKISFRLSNPTAFATNFTLIGSFQSDNGLEIYNLLGSAVVYPREAVEIKANIKAASTATVGSSNVFTLNATNDCLDLSAHRNITVIEQTTGSHITQTEAPTPADECGGCQNGGTCTVMVRRGRVIRRCGCPPDFGGRYCQVAY